MSDAAAHDPLDRKIIHALHIDGRASFSRIAEVLDVSPQTVSRRYTRLRSTGALRILGLTSPEAVNQEEWCLRIQCAPDAAVPVANALAQHEETTWVHLTSGGTEIVCLARTDLGGEPILLRRLPETPRVNGITAHCLLHTYYGREYSIITKTGPLSAEQVDRLRPDSAPAAQGGSADLTPADHRMLDVLALDGRATYQDLARITGWSQSTVQRRMTELRRHGLLYFDVDYAPQVIGYQKLIILWLSVSPAALDAAGEALADHREAAFVSSTTGPTNLFAAITCADTRALHRYLTGPVATLPHVAKIETAPVIRTFKRAGLPTPATPARTAHP
jgi:DNA-binding Lrp family transcriptional regulator